MNKDVLRNEIIACGRDPNYFIRKYVKIRHPTKGIIPFSMFTYQEQLVKDYQEYRFNVILKARQLGISEVTAAYAVWMMLFHRDKNILVMATKAETAKNIIKKVTTAFKKLPQWLMLADVITDNKLSVELSNGSVIKAIASSDDAGRSEALSLLILDEAAFIKGLDELWTGLFPTVQAGGSVIVMSTPNGVGNKFHQLYTDAEEAKNEFHATRLMWWLHPDRVAYLKDDENRPGFKTSPWYVNEIKSANMGPREVAQELECNFNASGDTVIPTDAMDWVKSGLIDPMSKEHWDRNLFTWWEPREKHRYFVSADVSRGDGKDYSAASVFDIDSMEQVAEYYGKVPVEEFASILCEMGHKYYSGMLVVENNSIGLACLEHIRLAGYENVYYSRKGDNKPGEAVNTVWGSSTEDLVIGFTMSPKSRPLVLAKFEEYIRNKTIIMRSKRFSEELRTFIWNNGRPEAMRGYNDDLVMSTAIGCWIRDTFLATNVVNADVQRKLLGGISSQTHVNTEIKGASKNPDHVPSKTLGVFNDDVMRQRQAMRVRLPNGQIADFSWLVDSKISKG